MTSKFMTLERIISKLESATHAIERVGISKRTIVGTGTSALCYAVGIDTYTSTSIGLGLYGILGIKDELNQKSKTSEIADLENSFSIFQKYQTISSLTFGGIQALLSKIGPGTLDWNYSFTYGYLSMYMLTTLERGRKVLNWKSKKEGFIDNFCEHNKISGLLGLIPTMTAKNIIDFAQAGSIAYLITRSFFSLTASRGNNSQELLKLLLTMHEYNELKKWDISGALKNKNPLFRSVAYQRLYEYETDPDRKISYFIESLDSITPLAQNNIFDSTGNMFYYLSRYLEEFNYLTNDFLVDQFCAFEKKLTGSTKDRYLPLESRILSLCRFGAFNESKRFLKFVKDQDFRYFIQGKIENLSGNKEKSNELFATVAINKYDTTNLIRPIKTFNQVYKIPLAKWKYACVVKMNSQSKGLKKEFDLLNLLKSKNLQLNLPEPLVKREIEKEGQIYLQTFYLHEDATVIKEFPNQLELCLSYLPSLEVLHNCPIDEELKQLTGVLDVSKYLKEKIINRIGKYDEFEEIITIASYIKGENLINGDLISTQILYNSSLERFITIDFEDACIGPLEIDTTSLITDIDCDINLENATNFSFGEIERFCQFLPSSALRLFARSKQFNYPDFDSKKQKLIDSTKLLYEVTGESEHKKLYESTRNVLIKHFS